MVVFAVELDNSKVGRSFVRDTHVRLQANDFASNPFSEGFCKIYLIDKKKFWAIMNMEALYINPYVLTIATLFGAFIFKGLNFSWLYLVPLFFGLANFTHTKYFFYLLFKLGLRKEKYHGKTKLVRNNDLLLRLSREWLKKE